MNVLTTQLHGSEPMSAHHMGDGDFILLQHSEVDGPVRTFMEWGQIKGLYEAGRAIRGDVKNTDRRLG